MLLESVRNYEDMSAVGASMLYAAVMGKLSRGERFNLGLAPATR